MYMYITPPSFDNSYYGLLQQKVPASWNGHRKCAYTGTKYPICMTMRLLTMVSIALVCIYNGNQDVFDPHHMHEW